jgi:hypothetical protein
MMDRLSRYSYQLPQLGGPESGNFVRFEQTFLPLSCAFFCLVRSMVPFEGARCRSCASVSATGFVSGHNPGRGTLAGYRVRLCWRRGLFGPAAKAMADPSAKRRLQIIENSVSNDTGTPLVGLRCPNAGNVRERSTGAACG